MTLYEQIDPGLPWTGTKKMLMIVPTTLCYLACSLAKYDYLYISINIPLWFFFCVLPKIPEMHR